MAAASVILLVGMPGSGKTHYCRTVLPDHVRLSQDEGPRRFESLLARFCRLLDEGADRVVVDRTNPRRSQRSRFIEAARSRGRPVRIVYLDVPAEVCLARIRARTGHPTLGADRAEIAIRRFLEDFDAPDPGECDEVVMVVGQAVGDALTPAAGDYAGRFAAMVEVLLRGADADAERCLAQIAEAPTAGAPARKGIPLDMQFAVFRRDHFTCRYCGRRTLFAPVLRLVATRFPAILRYHPNWKMSETDVAFWREAATCDHVMPVARGGASDAANLVTACYMCQSMKQNWLVGELRWPIRPVTEACWDGLAGAVPALVALLGTKVSPGSDLRRWARLVGRVPTTAEPPPRTTSGLSRPCPCCGCWREASAPDGV